MTAPERDPNDSELKVISERRLKVPVKGADRSMMKVSSGPEVTPMSLLRVFVRAQAELGLVSVGQTYVVGSEL
jgi:hypothetical protein